MSLAGVVGRWAGQGARFDRGLLLPKVRGHPFDLKLCLAVVSRFDVRSMTNVAKRFYQI